MFYNIDIRSKGLKEVKAFRQLAEDRKLHRLDKLDNFVTAIHTICASDFATAIEDLPRRTGNTLDELFEENVPAARGALAAMKEALMPYSWASLIADLVDSGVPAVELVDEDHPTMSGGIWIEWGNTRIWTVFGRIVFDDSKVFNEHHQRHLAECNFACHIRERFVAESAAADVARRQEAMRIPEIITPKK